MASKHIAITTIMLLAFAFRGLTLQGQPSPLNRPDDALRMFVLSRDLWAPVELQALNYTTGPMDPNTAELLLRQACLFLQAAVQLDYKNDSAWYDLVFLLTTDVISDPGRATQAIVQYSNLKSEDEYPIEIWLRYRLNLLNDLKTREYYLEQSLPALEDYPSIYSQALTRLGKMAWEKGIIDDIQTSSGKTDIVGARSRFLEAIKTDINNIEALEYILELPPPEPVTTSMPLAPQQKQAQKQALQAQHELYSALVWRLRLRQNPYHLQTLLNLIETLDGLGQHELAQEYYEYAFNLLALTPQLEDLVRELRFKQLVSAYSGKLYSACLNIAQQALKDSPGDLLISALHAKAMQKLGMQNQAQRLMQNAAESAREKLATAQKPDPQLQSELAWFFCFIYLDPVLALQYAQSAQQVRPDDPRAADILAYAQVLNQQFENARSLLEATNSDDPIAALAWAKIFLNDNNNAAARQQLEKITPAQSGILAEDIQNLLDQIPPDAPDPDSPATKSESVEPQLKKPEIIAPVFNEQFNGNDLLIIDAPEKFIRCSVWFAKDIFQFGEPILAQLYLTNISNINKQDTPISLGPDSWLDPHLLISAEIDPADSNFRRGLLSHRYLIHKNILLPGKSNSITEALAIGSLGRILEDHPQLEYKITLRCVLDPVPDGKGGFTGKIPALQPSAVTITRKAFIPTQERLNAYLSTLATGVANERIRATQLMAGLLREQQLARRQHLSYTIKTIDERAIRDLISKNLSHADERVRAWSAYALHSLPLSADSPEGQKLAQLLNDSDWFVRFMTLNTLNPVTDLTEYFNWADVLEKNALILRQIQLLQRRPWKVIDMPVEIPEPEDTTSTTESKDSTNTSVPLKPMEIIEP